jgi:hypothetical protein
MTPDENDPKPPESSWLASYRSGRNQALEPKTDDEPQAEAKSKAPLLGLVLTAAIIAAAFLALWAAGVGSHSSAGSTTTTTTTTTAAAATTTTPPHPTIRAFNPAVNVESQAYFVSLWKSIKAAQIQIRQQARVVKNDPTASNQTELIGLQQNCTTVVATYNAAALAIVSKVFRAVGLPSQISPDACSPPPKG